MTPSDSPRIRTLDVRPMIARGEEPFAKIMRTVAGLSPGENFLLVTPFLPAPLIERLRADGFVARPERDVAGAWRTLFSRT